MIKKIYIPIILLFLSISCFGEEKVSFLGCIWNIPNEFVERGEDGISHNSWFYLDEKTYKNIFFGKIGFDLKKFIETNTFLGESVIGKLHVYDFESADETESVKFKFKIITRDNTSYISLIDLSDDDFIDFSRSCQNNAEKQ